MDVENLFTKALDCTYGEYKKICKRFGRDYSGKSSCAKCGHQFTDEETPIIVLSRSKEKLICYKCLIGIGGRNQNEQKWLYL